MDKGRTHILFLLRCPTFLQLFLLRIPKGVKLIKSSTLWKRVRNICGNGQWQNNIKKGKGVMWKLLLQLVRKNPHHSYHFLVVFVPSCCHVTQIAEFDVRCDVWIIHIDLIHKGTLISSVSFSLTFLWLRITKVIWWWLSFSISNQK